MTNLMVTCPDPGPVGLERARFFPRQLVTPDDLMQDQLYFRDRLRRHNRLLHGWGVVCGLRVRWDRKPWIVTVESGFALGPQGDDIVVPSPRAVDLRKQTPDGNAIDPCSDSEDSDPWCSDVTVSRKEGHYFLAIRYAECRTHPVRAATGVCGCGCGGSECEYTRIRDSYALAVLRELPPSYPQPMKPPTLASIFQCFGNPVCATRPCPPCPKDPWVILADLDVRSDGTVSVDCYAHRRYVASFADFYFMCQRHIWWAGLPFAPVSLAVKRSITTSTPFATMRVNGVMVRFPGVVAVSPDDKVADVLNRDGDLEFTDPVTGMHTTLRELAAAASVDPAQPVSDGAALMELFDGRDAPVEALRAAREQIGDRLADRDALDRLGGSVARAEELPMTALKVDPRLRDAIERASVGDVAAVDQKDFVASIVRGREQEHDAAELEKAANDAWNAARDVAMIARHLALNPGL